MPRPKSNAEAEVVSALRGYTGTDIHYPATLTTLYAVRNAVYRYNKENNKRFRCIIRDDGVTLTERPMQSAYENAAKEVKSVLLAAKASGERDVDEIMELIRDAVTKHLSDESDVEDEDSVVMGRRRRR